MSPECSVTYVSERTQAAHWISEDAISVASMTFALPGSFNFPNFSIAAMRSPLTRTVCSGKAGCPVASMTVTCVKARTSRSDSPPRSCLAESRWDTRLMVPTAREFTMNSRRVTAIRSPSAGCYCRRSVTCLCVEDQFHHMTELCPVLAGWRRSVRNFRNGLGVLNRRIVVRAMHDDHVEGWNDENEMSPISPRGIDSRKRDFREVNAAVIHPPEILVTAAIRAVGLHHLIGVTTFFDPGFGHDLFAVP